MTEGESHLVGQLLQELPSNCILSKNIHSASQLEQPIPVFEKHLSRHSHRLSALWNEDFVLMALIDLLQTIQEAVGLIISMNSLEKIKRKRFPMKKLIWSCT